MKKKNIYRIAGLLLIVCLAFALAACGEDKDPNAGVYNCTLVSTSGLEMDAASVFEQGVVLELNDNGKGNFTVDGEGGSIGWTLDGTDFTMDVDGETCAGTLSDGVIVMELLDSGMMLTMEKETAQ